MPSYSTDIKVLAVNLYIEGNTLAEINGLLKRNISRQSLAHWFELYEWSNAVVRDPDFYHERGRPKKIKPEQREYLAEMVRQSPELYLRELKQKLFDDTGTYISIKTLHRELTERLNITWKRSNLHLAKRDEERRLAWMEEYMTYPAEYLVFTGWSSSLAPCSNRLASVLIECDA